MSDWPLIETAPRDGKPICVAGKDGKWWFQQARWDDHHEEWVCDTGDQYLTPTHWMPLPE